MACEQWVILGNDWVVKCQLTDNHAGRDHKSLVEATGMGMELVCITWPWRPVPEAWRTETRKETKT